MLNKKLSSIRKKQARILIPLILSTIILLQSFKNLHPIDMLLPAALAQSIAMIVFLRIPNIPAFATATLSIAFTAMLPGLIKPILSMKS